MSSIEYIEMHIVDHCNLNCASCTHFSPLVKEPKFKDFLEFKREITKLAELFPKLSILRIMGGEPLLHPNFADFCKFARLQFPKAHISLVTNGILFNKYKDILQDLIDNYNIFIDISNYNLTKADHTAYFTNTLNKTKKIIISNRSAMYNPCLDFTGTLNKEEMYKYCFSNNHCTFLRNGKLYVCPVLGNLDYYINYFNLNINLNPELYSISIFENSADDIIRFLDHNSSGCIYCNTPKIDANYHKFYKSERKREEWEINIGE